MQESCDMKKAVIFDLDGVIVSTDEYHYAAWKKIADEEGIYFDREINELLRGVTRLECLKIILQKAEKIYSDNEKFFMTEQKNTYYIQLLAELTAESILPGVLDLLNILKNKGIKVAIGSSSKNACMILERIGLRESFDAIVDGNRIKHSKPDPEVFLLAAEYLGLTPDECVVIEDAAAGIDAALRAGMKAVGVGSASMYDNSDVALSNLSVMKVDSIMDIILNDHQSENIPFPFHKNSSSSSCSGLSE